MKSSNQKPQTRSHDLVHQSLVWFSNFELVGQKMLFLECWLPSWLPWQQNRKNQSETSNKVTWSCAPITIMIWQFWTSWTKMLFLECWQPSWLPWQRNEKKKSETTNEVTWPCQPIATMIPPSWILLQNLHTKNDYKTPNILLLRNQHL